MPIVSAIVHLPRLRLSLRSFVTSLLCFAIVWTAQSHPGSSPRKETLQHRAANAAREMRHYRQRLAAVEKRARLANSLQAIPKVGVTLPDNLSSASALYFHDDMEGGVNGWSTTTLNGPGLWHQTTGDANSPTHSWWIGSEALGTYNTGARVNDALISPAVNLVGASGPITLLFTEEYVTEAGWDFCMVDVSSDGGTTWTALRGNYGDAPSGDSHGWQITTLDLSAYAGEQILVRYNFDTGDTLFNDFPGWWVDNVAIYDQGGMISGEVFFDTNTNGILDTGEPGLGDWLLTITGPITLTLRSSSNGQYSIPLPLGSYLVSEYVEAPWTQTAPPTTTWTADLTTPGQTVGGLDFGNHRPCSVISGLAFNDLDGNGVMNQGEPPLADAFFEMADSIGNSTYQLTNVAGQFSFLVFELGRYTVAEYTSSDWTSTVPGGDPPLYTIEVGRFDTTIGGLLFGSIQSPYTASIGGYVFNDVNHNGLHDEHEPMVGGRLMEVYGPVNVLAVSDSTGRFLFHGLPAGTYTVRFYASVEYYAWAQSFPESTYTVILGEGELRDSLLFGAYKLSLGAIRGVAFNDLNRNGIRDTLEPGLSNWEVVARGPEPVRVTTRTDDQGNYELGDLYAGMHTVEIRLPFKWVKTLPAADYSIALADQEIHDSVDFGAYALRPGSIAGAVFNDLNANGTRDPGEEGLSGYTARLTGSAAGTGVTDDSGHYSFSGLWSGVYRVLLDARSHWRQTYPPALRPHDLTLGNEEDNGTVDFGVAFDTAFSLSFRTFLPESIALARNRYGSRYPDYARPDKVDFSIWFVNRELASRVVNSMTITFYLPVRDSLVITPRASQVFNSTMKKVVITFEQPLDSGSTVAVQGIGLEKPSRTSAAKPQRASWIWGFTDGTYSRNKKYVDSSTNTPLLPLPNALDLIYSPLASGLKVGLGGPHSVVHINAKDVMKSLIDVHGMHLGPPRCLGRYSNSLLSMKRQIRYLTPTKGNNILFAEAVALQTNIRASDMGFAPGGFGDLIFDEGGGNPYNGKSIRFIASKLDEYMSSYKDSVGKTCCKMPATYETLDSMALYAMIRKIDSAFSGPIDTICFGGGLVLSPVRPLSDVPYLHLDSSFSNIGSQRVSRPAVMELPQRFILEQNYPNPFNPTTTIEFYLLQPSLVTLKLYNILGQEVATLIDKQSMDEGWNETEVSSDAFHLATGVYYYRLVAETLTDEDNPVSQTYTMVKKMMLMK